MTKNFIKDIYSELKEYEICGDYRYKKTLLSKIPYLKEYNESNSIITKSKIITCKTIYLPFIPSYIPRIATIILSSYNDIIFCSINTHLDFLLKSVQKRQLSFLEKIIKEYSNKYPTIVTGDFNMEVSDKNLSNFINNLEELGLIRVPINESTHKSYKTAIDHIFISKSFKIEKFGLIESEDLEKITDHKGVYVKVSF